MCNKTKVTESEDGHLAIMVPLRLSPLEAQDLAIVAARPEWNGKLSALVRHYFLTGRDVCQGNNDPAERERRRSS